MTTFIRKAKKIFHRYQSRAGGFHFGDIIWSCYKYPSKKYKLNSDEVVFSNTLHEDFVKDRETLEYLQNLRRILDSISKNIRVSIHQKFYPRDATYLIILKCKFIIDI